MAGPADPDDLVMLAEHLSEARAQMILEDLADLSIEARATEAPDRSFTVYVSTSVRDIATRILGLARE